MLLTCPACLLVFRPVDVGAWNAAELYDASYFCGDDAAVYGDYLGDEYGQRRMALQRLRRLRSMVTAKVPKLLDVGCAAGFFLDEAQRSGWDVRGIEVSGLMAQTAKERFGLHVLHADFRNMPMEPHAFDVITMWDYIEHSPDPSGDIRRAKTLLKPGGVLAISTGDISSFAARCSGARWHLLSPRYHLSYFSPSSVTALLHSAGFRDLQITHPGGRYGLGYLLHRLRSMADLSVLRLCISFLRYCHIGHMTVPVNLHDIMTVVARA